MKKFIYLAFITINSITGYSQIQQVETPKSIIIGKVKNGMYNKYELSFTISNNNDTLYHLYYGDLNYTQLNVNRSVYFIEKGNTLNDFYNLLINAFENEVDKQILFNIGDSKGIVTTGKMMGIKYLSVSFQHNDGTMGTTNMSKKEIDKLFGRNNK